MSNKFIPYGHQSISEEDIQAVVDILRGDWLTMGPSVEEFERAFADYIGVREAVTFSNGTAALHGAMHAAGVRPGDGVVAPSMTFAATSNAAVYCSAVPLFADLSPQTLCLDPEQTRAVCKSAKRPIKVIAPVSFAGYPVDIAAFREVAAANGALLIEDASHALGAERGARKVGQEADLTTFSFHPVKHITTGEGGMVTTNSPELAHRLRVFRSHGIVKQPDDFVRPYAGPWDNDMIDLGYNYRLSDISCALGMSQLKRVDAFVARRKAIASEYREKLSDIPGTVLPPDHPGHSYHLFSIWVEPHIRKNVFMALRKAQIGVQVHYVPVHLHTYYRNTFAYKEGDYPNTERLSAGEISLPIYPDMTGEDIDFVVDQLRQIVPRAMAVLND
ncbi:UDP-4-amino-4,6-dideoxy-N-acetyl-beta-L-altrosamine transaminase [Synergistaceae bacterium OttesenSCG-928-I11]|nr:UDP-4-amino-4,6-dideoxy-N-acetyl-beta-L-altrosamine transaminase [Synergistaceae bacterium OttesenSCG-928-I11]